MLCVGPVVRDLSAAFDEYWNSDKSRAIESLIPKIATDERQRHFNDAVQAGTTRLGERQRDVFGRTSFLRQLAAGELTLDHGEARVLVDSPAKGAERAGAQDRSTVAAEVLALLASTREEALEFINDTSLSKRAKVIDKLLNSDGYNSHLFNYFADMMRVRMPTSLAARK